MCILLFAHPLTRLPEHFCRWCAICLKFIASKLVLNIRDVRIALNISLTLLITPLLVIKKSCWKIGMCLLVKKKTTKVGVIWMTCSMRSRLITAVSSRLQDSSFPEQAEFFTLPYPHTPLQKIDKSDKSPEIYIYRTKLLAESSFVKHI